MQNGGVWLAVVDASPDPLPEILGVAVAPPKPICELRVLLETADRLLLDEPIAAPLSDSVKVVAIMEAASRSIRQGGAIEVLDGG